MKSHLLKNQIIMFIVMLCLFIATCLPFLSKIVVGVVMSKEGKYDNQHPREQQKRLTGFGARALAAHQNSFEALLIFSVAILSAVATQQVTWLTNVLAISFITTRIFYHIAYVMNYATLRSLVWFVGFFSSMTILGCCIPF